MMDLLKLLIDARKNKGLSQDALAKLVGSDRQSIARIEKGIGSADLVMNVMTELDLRLIGVGKGSTLPAQLRATRHRLGLTLDQVGERAGLTRKTVASVEAGTSSAASLASVIKAIAPQAKQATPIRASFDYNHSNDEDRDKRFTPTWFLDHVSEVWGAIDLDPCGHPQSAVQARRRISLPECGLAADWSGAGLVYVNPPFSGVVKWMEKAADAWETGRIGTIVMLTPVRVDSETFQKRVHRHADVLLLAGRMRFFDPEGKLSYPAPFGLMVSIFGGTNEQTARFGDLVPSVLLARRAG